MADVFAGEFEGQNIPESKLNKKVRSRKKAINKEAKLREEFFAKLGPKKVFNYATNQAKLGRNDNVARDLIAAVDLFVKKQLTTFTEKDKPYIVDKLKTIGKEVIDDEFIEDIYEGLEMMRDAALLSAEKPTQEELTQAVFSTVLTPKELTFETKKRIEKLAKRPEVKEIVTENTKNIPEETKKEVLKELVHDVEKPVRSDLILVPHDPKAAEFANRIVNLKKDAAEEETIAFRKQAIKPSERNVVDENTGYNRDFAEKISKKNKEKAYSRSRSRSPSPGTTKEDVQFRQRLASETAEVERRGRQQEKPRESISNARDELAHIRRVQELEDQDRKRKAEHEEALTRFKLLEQKLNEQIEHDKVKWHELKIAELEAAKKQFAHEQSRTLNEVESKRKALEEQERTLILKEKEIQARVTEAAVGGNGDNPDKKLQELKTHYEEQLAALKNDHSKKAEEEKIKLQEDISRAAHDIEIQRQQLEQERKLIHEQASTALEAEKKRLHEEALNALAQKDQHWTNLFHQNQAQFQEKEKQLAQYQTAYASQVSKQLTQPVTPDPVVITQHVPVPVPVPTPDASKTQVTETTLIDFTDIVDEPIESIIGVRFNNKICTNSHRQCQRLRNGLPNRAICGRNWKQDSGLTKNYSC